MSLKAVFIILIKMQYESCESLINTVTSMWLREKKTKPYSNTCKSEGGTKSLSFNGQCMKLISSQSQWMKLILTIVNE